MFTREVPQEAVRAIKCAGQRAYAKVLYGDGAPSTHRPQYLAECAYSNTVADGIREWKNDTLDDRIGAL